MAEKSAQKAKNASIAGRLKYLRSGLFKTEGFALKDDPSLAEARSMYYRNLRLMNAQRPTPSMRQN